MLSDGAPTLRQARAGKEEGAAQMAAPRSSRPCPPGRVVNSRGNRGGRLSAAPHMLRRHGRSMVPRTWLRRQADPAASAGLALLPPVFAVVRGDFLLAAFSNMPRTYCSRDTPARLAAASIAAMARGPMRMVTIFRSLPLDLDLDFDLDFAMLAPL